MFSFLQPYWLWACTAIVLPVVIHLWNVKQGKIKLVGSISFMLQSDRQQAKSFRLKDLLLLLIRCLLIIVLAILLAGPQYAKPLHLENTKGWLLIEKEQLKTAYEQYQPLIDSLNNAGFLFHYFEDEFTELPFTKALQKADTFHQTTQKNYWQLLSRLNQQVPSQLPVYLFTSNKLIHFKGRRTNVNLDLHWIAINVADSISRFITNAHENSNGQLAISVANSTEGGTAIETLKSDPNALPSFITYHADSNLVFMAGQKQYKVPLDTSTLNVCIYAGKYSNDAFYLKAAMDAIKSFTDYKISYTVSKNTSDIPAKPEWLFWLSDDPIPVNITPKNLMHYAKGKEVNNASWLMMENNQNKQDQAINISKMIQPGKQSNQQKIWTDGYGNPLLTANTGTNNSYTFYSRFSPEWNGLVWNRYFPEMLLNLLYPKNNTTINAGDQRVMERSQYLPAIKFAGNYNKQNFIQIMPLEKWFWVLVFLLFCLERLLSFKTKKEALNG